MKDFDQYIEFQREIAEMKLKIINKYQGRGNAPTRLGQLAIVEEILKNAGHPLHINEIVKIARHTYDIDLNRDSVTSAIAKKIKTGSNFVRTSPNTFFIKASGACREKK